MDLILFELVLNVIIKSFTFLGIVFFLYQYKKIVSIDKKINKISNSILQKMFEETSTTCYPNTHFLNSSGEYLTSKEMHERFVKNLQLELESLQEKRSAIISIIPFLKN